MDLKRGIVRQVKPLVQQGYAERGERYFVERHRRPPMTRAEARPLVESDARWRWYSALARAQHEAYVDATAECVERQADVLRERCRELAQRAGERRACGAVAGTLTLDPSVQVPAYQRDVDVHCVPGGYFMELMPDDVYAAARYELGISLYTLGDHGAMNETKGLSGVAFVRQRFPSLRPRRILDLGCTCGNSTLPWGEAFPDAQLHALDASAPALRYAHARAEALQRAVHFLQADAEAPPYPDGYFDLVVSHILLHETSAAAVARIFAACHRLLAPGGVMLHVEVPVRNAELSPFDQVMVDWDTENNNEVFWRGLHDMDLPAAAEAAGFAPEAVFDEFFDAGHRAFINSRPWWLFGAQRTAQA